jgi:D-amino-acid dehydrogenase
MSSPGSPVTVIGAGIVGLACARWLQRGGHDVTVVDPVAPGESCSFGNAGIISTSSVTPLAMPGTLAKLPGWLIDPKGPLVVRWPYLPRAMPWLLRLLAASRRSRIPAIADALRALNAPSLDAFSELLGRADFADLIRQDGVISAYESVAALDADAEVWAMRKARGALFERVEGAALRDLEPAINPLIPCAMFVQDTAHTINPLRMAKTLAARFLGDGGVIVENRVTRIECGEQGPRTLHLDGGAAHPVEVLVIAAGAWSRRLSSPLGSTPPLEAERGYHVTIAEAGIALKRPVSLASRGFYATPMELGLRIAGTVEFGGLDAPPDYRRADILLDHGRFLFPGLRDGGVSRWMGCRPSMPDSLPVIGRSPHYERLYYAFGHGHLGLTEGAITGKLIAELIAGKPTSIDIDPYRIDRF